MYFEQSYKLGNILGQGAFAKVYKANRVADNQIVALKVFDKKTIEKNKRVGVYKVYFFIKKAIAKEMLILRILKSPFIVKCHEVFETTDKIYLVMDYMEGGELFDKIKKMGNFGEREACILFKKLL